MADTPITPAAPVWGAPVVPAAPVAPVAPADGLKDTQEPAAKPPVDTAPPAASESMTVRMWHAVKGYADVHVNEVENWAKHEWQKVVDKV